MLLEIYKMVVTKCGNNISYNLIRAHGLYELLYLVK